MSTFKVVIPARYASTRLPGKPLIDLAGTTMIERVVMRALDSHASEVVVATDDERVAQAVARTPARALMTDPDHASGSDRVMEVASVSGWANDEVIVNVQGDEPLIPPGVIDQVAGLLEAGAFDVATLSEPISVRGDVFNPNIVKVVASASGSAMYFSRAPIPWARGDFDAGAIGVIGHHWRRHIGIYAYRVGALARFVALPRSPIEQTEELEQMRFLENDISIAVQESVEPVPGGVDTQEDADRVIEMLTAG